MTIHVSKFEIIDEMQFYCIEDYFSLLLASAKEYLKKNFHDRRKTSVCGTGDSKACHSLYFLQHRLRLELFNFKLSR